MRFARDGDGGAALPAGRSLDRAGFILPLRPSHTGGASRSLNASLVLRQLAAEMSAPSSHSGAGPGWRGG